MAIYWFRMLASKFWIFLMYAITCIDDKQKIAVMTHDNKPCVFCTKDQALKYQTDILEPNLIDLITNGNKVKKLFKNSYIPIPINEKQKLTKMLETLLVRPIESFKFKTVR